MKKSKQEYIAYRIGKSHEALKDCKVLAENNRWNLCVSRLYYALFYMASPLLLKNDFTSKTHNGTKSKFFDQFVKNDLINKRFGNLYSDLLDWRQKNDYSDFFDFDQESVFPKIREVEEFINEIEKLIKS